MIQIAAPGNGAFVPFKSFFFIEYDGDDPRGPIVYVRANDDIWYRQAPAVLGGLKNLYTVIVACGVPFLRSGWDYKVVAVAGKDTDFPPTTEHIPQEWEQSDRIPVTRR